MKKYIKTDESNNFDVDGYHRDMIFGEPTNEVLDVGDFINYLEDAIRFADESFDITSATILTSDNDSLMRVYVTSYFEKGIKELINKHRKDVLIELKDVIEKLLRLEVTRNNRNHPLKNAEGHLELHIDGGNLLLVYKYLSKDVISVALKLQDIVDHKELKRYNKKRYKSETKETTVDEIFKDAEV